MSFGWSAGDLAVAVKILYKVGAALKESSGASSDFQDTLTFLQTLSLTLRHIGALQTVSQDVEITENLQAHCTLIREPVGSFLAEIQSKYEHQLGQDSKWYKLQPAWKKLRWALSISDKAKELQGRITASMTAISVIMMHQTSGIISKMPEDIQQRITHTFDASIGLAVDNAMQSLTSSITRNDTSITSIQTTVDRNHQIMREGSDLTIAKLSSGFSTLGIQYGTLDTKLDGALDLIKNRSTAMIDLTSKLDINLTSTLKTLNTLPKGAPFDPEFRAIVQDILRGVWRLLACLQRMIHKLIWANYDAEYNDYDEDDTLQSSVDDKFADDVSILRQFSFISANKDGITFEMHGLVQLATRKWLEAHGQTGRWHLRPTPTKLSVVFLGYHLENAKQFGYLRDSQPATRQLSYFR